MYLRFQRAAVQTALRGSEIIQPRTASWTAVAERSGDTAFARKKISRTHHHHRAHESGVALRFPPQSKTHLVIPKPKRTRLVLLQFSA
jgi:hypothetical protein